MNGEGDASFSKLPPDELAILEKSMEEHLEFYQAENSRMETLFSKLGLTDLLENSPELEELATVQLNFDVDDLTIPALTLEYAEKLRQRSRHASKLTSSINIYTKLNQKLSNDIKSLQKELEASEREVKELETTTPEDLKVMQEKIGRYERKLAQFESKQHWLLDPKLDLQVFKKEIDALNKLRNEKQTLMKELSGYHGLKPDLVEATMQVAQIKTEYQEISKKLLN